MLRPVSFRLSGPCSGQKRCVLGIPLLWKPMQKSNPLVSVGLTTTGGGQDGLDLEKFTS